MVHLILTSLPTEYGPFKISYNTHNDEWSFNDLLAKCVEEEERLKGERVSSAHMASHKDKHRSRPKKSVHSKGRIRRKPLERVQTLRRKSKSQSEGSSIKCFFCKKKGHKKVDCLKYKK